MFLGSATLSLPFEQPSLLPLPGLRVRLARANCAVLADTYIIYNIYNTQLYTYAPSKTTHMIVFVCTFLHPPVLIHQVSKETSSVAFELACIAQDLGSLWPNK